MVWVYLDKQIIQQSINVYIISRRWWWTLRWPIIILPLLDFRPSNQSHLSTASFAISLQHGISIQSPGQQRPLKVQCCSDSVPSQTYRLYTGCELGEFRRAAYMETASQINRRESKGDSKSPVLSVMGPQILFSNPSLPITSSFYLTNYLRLCQTFIPALKLLALFEENSVHAFLLFFLFHYSVCFSLSDSTPPLYPLS